MIESLLAASGALFVWKYSPRLGVSPALAVPAYLVLFAALTLACRRASRAFPRPWIAAALYACAAAPLFLRIHPETLRVDRWSALRNFLSALFAGKFPYASLSHLDHPISGFPILFVLAAPFYLLGDVGWMQFAALAAFAALALRRHEKPAAAAYALFLLLLHPAFAYEVFCRSDLFFNMTLAAWLIFLLRNPGRETSMLRCLGEGALWGLALATRGVMVIPFLVYSGESLRTRGLARSAATGLSAALCAGLTFVPFFLWNRDLFYAHNPLSVQSGYIPRWLLMITAALSALSGYLDPQGRRVFRDIGLLLFGTVAACLALTALSKGWTQTLWNGSFDITYFSLSFPFLLLAAPKANSREAHLREAQPNPQKP